jgi:sugar lactone lactonase YvrE
MLSAMCVLMIGGLVAWLLTSSSPGITRDVNPNQPAVNPLRTTPLPTMVQFARLTMAFGSKGDQPGQFDDARSIAVDIQGNIFVADYTTGRINKFDPQGNFLQLIQVNSTNGNTDVYIFGIAADDLGNLYVAADGNILKYNASSGELLLTIPDQWPDIYYQSVIVAPDGNLYSTNGMAGADDVLILNPDGELLVHWAGTIENVNHDDPSIELAIGVNHTGMVYILSPFGNKVYVYNPDGSFNFSFGEEGDRAGQFSLSTGMLAVTAQDYLVISDVYRVDLFDNQGNYLGKTFTIDYNVAEGSMFGMTIDAEGDLYYLSSGGKVLKFDMNYP